MCAAETLESSPLEGEPVIVIPPDSSDSSRDRTFIRIGAGTEAWIGSFGCGDTVVSTAYMLPDGKHVFVCAEGAGYIIELKSRTLVETAGADIIGIMRDEPMTMLVVNHGDKSLEAFGRTGRLWKTDTIGAGGFRDLSLTEHELIGEARHPSRPGWTGFSVNLATGAVGVHQRDWCRVCNPRRGDG
jgi:hypothetical protein